MTTLGKEIRKARIDKSLLQKDLAKKLNLPQQYISKIESDKVDVRFSTLQRIANELGVKLSSLIQATEEV